MELIPQRLKFYGDGGKYFGIVITNFFLTVITLGFYYPWAKAKNMQYLYGETEFAGSRLQYHGTGKEMFKGFIKAILLVGIVMGFYALAQANISFVSPISLLLYLLGLFAIIPLAIHGGLRYRMSRTSWRGIHFGYRGKLGELYKIFAKGVFFTIGTFGFYVPWFIINVRRYCINHIRLGNCQLSYTGQGSEYFGVLLAGRFFTFITLGIYYPWFLRDLNYFLIDNILIEQDGYMHRFQSTLKGSDVFKVLVTNILLVVFSLGLALPWAMLRYLRLTLDNIQLEGAFNPEIVMQTEEDYSNATGDDMLDMLDIGLDF